MPSEQKTLSELGIFQTRKPIFPCEEECKEEKETPLESKFISSTIERKRREIVIPIKPTGETYKRGTDTMNSSITSIPSSSSTPSEKKVFIIPKVELDMSPDSNSQTIVMRKKKSEVNCTADTVINAPKVRQTAVKTILSCPSSIESASLSILLPSQEEKNDQSMEQVSGEQMNEVDRLEEEIGRRLKEISTKSQLLTKTIEKSLNESNNTGDVLQPVHILPSSLPPKYESEVKMKGGLASRVREGIADFTSGSTDRLQKWKCKLHSSSRRIREKDTSAPPPISRSMSSSSPEVLVDWSVRPRPLHVTRSASNAITLGVSTEGMEHRTRKEDVILSTPVYYNVHHSISRPSLYESLPPPARIVPFSGTRPTENSDIIRPIAFRPLTNQGDDIMRKCHKIEHTKSALNLSSVGMNGLSPQVIRPRAIIPSSSSNNFTSNGPFRVENEYDTVSDILTTMDHHKNEASSSEFSKLSASSGSNGSSFGTRKTNSRQSTAAHVTPSPSDSGIVDYETIIRDKEHELQDVRKTMEHNEEIIVKVYMEKEKTWKEQLEQLKARLTASEKGETALRMQMSSVSRQAEGLGGRVKILEDDKKQLLNKMREMESRQCPSCRSRLSTSSSSSSSFPIPAPRTVKCSSDNEANLREEVSELRREVATLKDSLLFLPSTTKNPSIYANNNTVISPRDRLI